MAALLTQKIWSNFPPKTCILCQFKRFYAKKLGTKLKEQKEIDSTVFEYVSNKRTDRIYAWGYAATGALGVATFMRPERGYNHRTFQISPKRLGYLDDMNLKVKNVACGYGFTIFLCEQNGQQLVFGTGINTDSQLGFQEYPKNSGRILDYIIEPVEMELPTVEGEKMKLLKSACGRAHTVIATDAGKIFTFGNNAYGQCGRGIVEDELYRGNPTINNVKIDFPLKQVVCGQDHTLFLSEDGQVYSCGLGADGQTGLGHYQCASEITQVKGDIDGEKIVHISSVSDTVLAASEKGDVFGWGNSEYSQLSKITESTQVNLPRSFPFNNVGKVTKVAAGGSICGLLNDKGEVYVWGYGILGKGPKLDQSKEPSLIPPPIFGINEFNPDSKVDDLYAGLNYFMAKTNKNDLYSWGRNKTAVLGLGHKLDQFFPFKVLVPAEVREVSCGVDHVVVKCKSFA